MIETTPGQLTDPATMLATVAGVPRIVFDLDGTIYDTRDFERPALGSVVEWLCERSGRTLHGMRQALWARRETDRHRQGLFDDLLSSYDLPVEWGMECLRRFQEYPGVELKTADSLRLQLCELRAQGCKLALVSNGRPANQERKVDLLGVGELFDICVYCDPALLGHLKPSVWGWTQLIAWKSELPAVYVGDDPVDACFARTGGARFVPFAFRNSIYEN